MNIGVIGAGYLGKEVAALWTKRKHHVTVTTRSPEHLEALSHVAQKSIILKDSDGTVLAPLIHENEVLLVTVAASDPENYESTYLKTAQTIRLIGLESQTIRRIIYTSSTSVYGDHQGLWLDETAKLKAKSHQAKILIETERVYESLREIGWHVCILRLTELYGPGREISQRLSSLNGQRLPGTGQNYSNMVHQEDAIAAIDYALKHKLNGTYNLADDDHPTRLELYEEISKKFQLPMPQWDPAHVGIHGGNKRISNHKIKAEGFTFTHPHRVIG